MEPVARAWSLNSEKVSFLIFFLLHGFLTYRNKWQEKHRPRAIMFACFHQGFQLLICLCNISQYLIKIQRYRQNFDVVN